MYWYAGEKDSAPIDGIKFSSRFDATNNKDRDLFYFRKKNISVGLTTNITELHGYLIGSEGGGYSFESSSNTQNLFYEGIYFYQDTQQRQEIITVPLEKNNIIDLEFFEPKVDDKNNGQGPYIGYDKIIIFSDESKPGDAAQVSSLLLPKNEQAKKKVGELFQYFCATTYETINLKAYVSRPLKHWGYFEIAVESDESIADKYLYSTISYDFKIFENLIVANVKGARNPVIDQA